MVWSGGSLTTTGGVQVAALTVTVAGRLSFVPQEFEARTQYVVVCAGWTLIDCPKPADDDVSGGLPTNHWNVIGVVPVAAALSVANCPAVMVLGDGCVVIVGAVQPVWFTVTVADVLSIDPQEFVTRTQYVVVTDGDGVYVEEVLFGPGATGPLGGVPVYQRYVSVAVPEAETLRLA
jgi:hypothetical protein